VTAEDRVDDALFSCTGKFAHSILARGILGIIGMVSTTPKSLSVA
jgi:hypothetical protein